MTLKTYHQKRDFEQTPEPRGQVERSDRQRFVVQEHHASQLHFDFRLEMGGVLKSWAVPKGPSMNPADKRLAVAVEDHPVDYIDFEGRIAEGNYGAGDVAIWDAGEYETDSPDPERDLENGKLSFVLHGDKLSGEFSLVKMRGRGDDNWLLIKGKDREARKGWTLETVLDEDGATEQQPNGRRQRSANGNGRLAAEKVPQPRGSGEVGPIEAAMPDKVELMLATLVESPFDDEDWLFETKYDGVRALVYLDDGKLRLMTRNDHNVAARYPELASLPQSVKLNQAILDGEIVAFDDEGGHSFQRLQARVGPQDPSEIRRLAKQQPVVFCAFDLLYADGLDLRAAPLVERKRRLEQALKPGPAIQFAPHTAGKGHAAFEAAERAGLEGIIAKRQDSPYTGGRSGDWLKIKTLKRQEVVIGGFTAPRGSRPWLGALVVGVYEDDRLAYVGHVGGGFSHDDLAQVHKLLSERVTPTAPFADPPSTNEAVTWVRPELVAEVKFSEWTAEGCLRQPIFMGLRDDKEPRDVKRERPKPTRREVRQSEVKRQRKAEPEKRAETEEPEDGVVRTAAQVFKRKTLTGTVSIRAGAQVVKLTHVDKVYWPEEGYTKADLARYYWQVSKVSLPYLKDRPQILRRYPNGIDGTSFFQHDVNDAPGFIKTVSLKAENGREIDYVICDNLATMLYLVNLGNIGFHPWNARLDRLEQPDWVVLDLDPGEGTPFSVICDVALAVKDVLDRLELRAWPKTSGGRGLHVYVPIRAGATAEAAADFAQRVAAIVASENPRQATLERSLGKRPSKTVYVDHLQNATGKSVAAPYTVRPRPGATVSAPLTWAEVKRCPDPTAFTIKTVPGRLSQRGDLFRPVLLTKQSLPAALRRLEKLRT